MIILLQLLSLEFTYNSNPSKEWYFTNLELYHVACPTICSIRYVLMTAFSDKNCSINTHNQWFALLVSTFRSSEELKARTNYIKEPLNVYAS